MKVTVLQENLAKGLSLVGRAVSSRTSLQVLNNVLVATENGRLRLSATNLELGVTAWVGAKVHMEGETTVPARTFVDLVNAMRPGQVELNYTNRTRSLNLRGGTLNNDIKCIDATEFPVMPTIEEDEVAVELNVEDLRDMISHVVFAAASDDARPILTGVQIKIDGQQVTFAAADGFRLSVRTANLSYPVDDEIVAIVPAKALAELGRVIGDAEQPVKMALPQGRGQVIFLHKDVQLVSQLIDGTFPDYRQLIPTETETRVVVSTQELLAACKAVDIIARESAHTARFSVKPGGDLQPGVLEIQATSNELGSNEAMVDASIDGEALEIAFNVKYMVDVLNVLDSEHVELGMNTATSPGTIRPMGRDDFVHVIMPMRLS